MKEFLLVFRMDTSPANFHPSPEQMQQWMKQWQDWMGSLAAQNKLVSSGNRLTQEGKVVKANNVITNGPYADISESIGGYIILRAGSLEEAAELSTRCPILNAVNGSVEVRTILPMDNNS